MIQFSLVDYYRLLLPLSKDGQRPRSAIRPSRSAQRNSPRRATAVTVTRSTDPALESCCMHERPCRKQCMVDLVLCGCRMHVQPCHIRWTCVDRVGVAVNGSCLDWLIVAWSVYWLMLSVDRPIFDRSCAWRMWCQARGGSKIFCSNKLK